ncbi:MAG: hypothetical protein EU544_02370 [Promethearchaeota archaeon]|nr:MAG: hypothetical protein EU544_02370 [Candidatus Lokiarchaeota archaeon]
MPGKVRSEDTLIFNALTPKISKMKYFYEALEEFFKKKKAEDPSDRFDFIVFEELGPNYFENFTLNIDHVLLALQSLEPGMVRANVAGGIFTAITFIIDVFKKISEKCFRLIIFTDAGTLKIPESYLPALQGLIDQVKDMPFFMDVIRINIDDPREDLKLMRLARRTGGDIYEIDDIAELPVVLDKLAKKKEISTKLLVDERDFIIPEESQPFFENLAEDPFPILDEETCSICFKKDKEGLVQCPSCDTIAHKSCWANWAKNSNIGIYNVFRCHNCFNLLILDGDFVYAVQTGQEIPVEQPQVQVKDLQTYLEGLETDEGPQIIQVEDPLAVPAEEYEDIEIQFEDEEEVVEDFTPLDDDDLRIIFCPNCNKITTNEYRTCPACGFPLEDYL